MKKETISEEWKIILNDLLDTLYYEKPREETWWHSFRHEFYQMYCDIYDFCAVNKSAGLEISSETVVRFLVYEAWMYRGIFHGTIKEHANAARLLEIASKVNSQL